MREQEVWQKDWRGSPNEGQPVVDRNSIRCSSHGGIKELGLGIDYHHVLR